MDTETLEAIAEKVHECSVDGCVSPLLARGWCRMHYLRWYRSGSIETPVVSLSLHERLWLKVDKSGACWPRSGGSGSDYTRLSRGTNGQSGRARVLAHVLAWEEASGQPIPDDFDVLHVCDNKPCVRNDDLGVYIVKGISYERRGHLFLGTNAVNVADKVSKERQARGLTNGVAKATPEVVRELRRLFDRTDRAYGSPARQYRTLGEMFNLSPVTVRQIVSGNRWTWVQ